MSVRQYIGARYTTKIYENSLDPSSAEWEANVTYEPLTMVTYNNSTYLSKKQVPGSVGDPANNPDYWVVTGYYNGQIMQLQNDVAALKGKTDGVITPDMFTGANDAAKIQAAIDYAIANYYPTIILDRAYDITGSTLKINKDVYLTNTEFYRYRGNLNFVGIGSCEIYKGDSGFMFTADMQSGYMSFSSIKFRGSANAPQGMSTPDQIALRKAACSVFDASRLIFLNCFNCEYQQLNIVFDSRNCVDVTTNMQDINTYGDKVTYCNAYVSFGWAWCCNFNGAMIENCNAGFIGVDDNSSRDISLTNINIICCQIEGTYEKEAIQLDFSGFSYSLIKQINIENSYFEENAVCDISINYINSKGLNIRNNIFNSKTVPSIKKAGSFMDDHINYNYFLSDSYGIDCSYLSHKSDYKFNTFEQYNGTGSITNSTAAMLGDMIIYQGQVTASSVGTGMQTVMLTISDYGTIRNVKGIMVQSVNGTLSRDYTYSVWGVYNTELDLYVNNQHSSAQDFVVKYLVFGY